MPVTFGKPLVYTVPLSEDQSMDTGIMRESDRRSRLERSVDTKHLKANMDTWTLHPVNFVFGNLGRHPEVLHHYLDLHRHENIKIVADFETHYDDEDPDILIIVEPHFGYSVVHEAKHVVVLCSHASLNLPPDTHFSYLHLPDLTEVECLDLTDAKSAHEAYLRIVQAKKILMKRRDREILQHHVKKIEEMVKEQNWQVDWEYMPNVEMVEDEIDR